MVKDKPFLTYDEQMEYLRDNKIIFCKGELDKEVLIRLGYFNLINGYKTPFILSANSSGKHTYIGGRLYIILNA